MASTDNDTDMASSSPTLPYTPLQSLLPPLPPTFHRIYLMRHGETDWNAAGKIQGGGFDIPLNENGQKQAVKAAAELDGLPLSVIASSSLSRAKETADILHERHTTNRNHGLPPPQRIVDAGFNEMRFGEFEGFCYHGDNNDNDAATLQRLKAICKQTKQDIAVPFPGGGESTQQVMQRSTKALQELLQHNDNSNTTSKHIAVVAHGRTNKILIAATALGDVTRTPEVAQSNTAINVLDYDTSTKQFTPLILNHFEHVKDHVILRGSSSGNTQQHHGTSKDAAPQPGQVNDNNSKASQFLASSPVIPDDDDNNNNNTTIVTFDSIMNEVDHVANRVGLCTLMGFFGGAAWATLKRFPRRATALSAAGSCAIVATSLFGTERLANVALRKCSLVPPEQDDTRLTLSSYAFSGIVGGGLNGYVYQKKPARGMFFFVPLMLCVAGMELDWKHRKEARALQLQNASS